MMFKILKTCRFCKKSVLKPTMHFRTHGVNKYLCFLLNLYENGDSLLDIENKVNIKGGNTRTLFKKMKNKEKIYQQMLKEYERLQSKYGDSCIRPQVNNCVNARKMDKIQENFRHFQSLGLEDIAKFLLPHYENGDTLIDIQNKIEKLMSETRIYFNNIINKEEKFQQLLIDFKKFTNEFGDIKNKNLESLDLKLSNENVNYKDCIFCGIQCTKICQHLKSHGAIQPSSAFLLSFYEVGDTLYDLRMKILKSENHKPNPNLIELISKSNFQQMLLDYESIKNKLADEHNQLESAENLQLGSLIDLNNVNDRINHLTQQLMKLENSFNSSKHINKINDVKIAMETRANRQSRTKDAETQTVQKMQKHKVTQVEPMEDQIRTVGGNRSSLSEIKNYSDRESRIEMREQRRFELEEAIREMLEELDRIDENSEEEEEKIVSYENKEAITLVQCAVQLERCDMLLQSMAAVSVRKGGSGELVSSISSHGRTLRSRPETTTIVPEKTRESGGSLDTQKDGSASALELPSDHKIPGMSSKSENCSSSAIVKIESMDHDESVPGSLSMCMVSTGWNQHHADTDWNKIRVEPNAITDRVHIDHDRQLWSMDSNKLLEKVFRNLRMCLEFFLPPEWPVDKETIYSLSPADLADFPLDRFFDKYQQGLRKLFTNFQSETARVQEKLCSLRKNVLRALQMLNKVHDIDLSALFDEDIDRGLIDFLNI